MSEGFSIQVLASRTGVTTNVLRTWENRFGFPTGTRTTTGHRRFTETDVTLVRDVLKAREAGVPLQLAVDSVVRQHRHSGELSVHAAVVREFPELARHRYSRRALVAASRALEDETMAREPAAVVLGSFQAGHRFAEEEHRWSELARTAAWCAVVADFDSGEDGGLGADPTARPARCQLPESAPMRREWTVIALGRSFGAVVSGWEVPAAPGQPRIFESVISTHRSTAVVAARVITAVAEAAGATPPDDVRLLLAPTTPLPPATTMDADRVWARSLALLDAQR